MKAEDLINNNALSNTIVGSGQKVVYVEIALTAINMARIEERTIAESNQWISVEDELPSLQDNVLLLINGFPVIGLGESVNDKCLGVEYWARIPQLSKDNIMNNSNNEPETVTFTVQKGQTNCDNCKFKSLCYDANIELVHLLKCNVYDLNSITEVERQK